jgi:hypothetical protein
MGFAVFQVPSPGLRELSRLGLPIEIVRHGHGTHSQQRYTLRSFPLTHSVSILEPMLDSDYSVTLHQSCVVALHPTIRFPCWCFRVLSYRLPRGLAYPWSFPLDQPGPGHNCRTVVEFHCGCVGVRSFSRAVRRSQLGFLSGFPP